MARGLTDRQRQVLNFVCDYMRGEGRPPTVRDIANNFGFKSPKAASDHLTALERKGYITRTHGESRNISVRDELSPHGIPVLGKVKMADTLMSPENLEASLRPTELFDVSADTFAIKVTDNALEDSDIREGDYVVIKHGEPVESDDVAAVRMGEDVLVRRVQYKNGSVRLVGDDSSVEEIEEDRDAEDLDILGPMRGLIRKS